MPLNKSLDLYSLGLHEDNKSWGELAHDSLDDHQNTREVKEIPDEALPGWTYKMDQLIASEGLVAELATCQYCRINTYCLVAAMEVLRACHEY